MSFKGVQIKKYKQNRKFYAIELSRYVNLKDIAELFNDGCDSLGTADVAAAAGE